MQQSPASSQEEHVAELLSAYMDNRLAPVERLQVATHLSDCPSCRAQLASLQSTVLLLHELPVVPAPRPFYVYAEEAPAPRIAGFVQRLFAPGWVFGYLRLATTVASLLLVAVVAVDALSLSAPRVAAPAPAAYRGAVQPQITQAAGAVVDSTGAAQPAGAPTEPPKVTAPLTAPSTPSANAPTPAPAPPVASVGPGAAIEPLLLPPPGPVLPPPTSPGGNQAVPAVSPAPGGGLLSPGPAATPSASAKSANEVVTSPPSPSQPTGAGPAPASVTTATPSAEPASGRPTASPVSAEARRTQAAPSPTGGPEPAAVLIAPAAPTPARQSASAAPTVLPEPAAAAPLLAETPGVSLVRLGEISLGALVIILLALTLFARRGRKPAVRD
jgi:anti-sigma factor RsiW